MLQLLRIIKLGLFFLIPLACLSCSREYLRVQVDYISKQNLASYHVCTPDPRLINPPQGQRMLISWYLDREKLSHNINIKVTLRYGNQTEEEFWIYPKKQYGFYTLCLLNREYYEKGGIITYKAEMFIDHCLVKEWRHQLWTKLITFENTNN